MVATVARQPRIVPWSETRPGRAAVEAAQLLAAGEVVAHPTETVYGLAVLAGRREGYDALQRLKGGGVPRPFLLLFDSWERLDGTLGDLPPGGSALARAFWPGPLTLLFPARADLPDWWSGPDGDVAARVSPHPFCVELLRALGGPLLSTSANLPGEEPCETAGAIVQAFAGWGPALVVDGGRLQGRPSTILRWSEERGWTTLRDGPVSGRAVERALEVDL